MKVNKKINITAFLIIFMFVPIISLVPAYFDKDKPETESDVASFLHSSSLMNRSEYVNFTEPPVLSVFNKYFRVYINDNDPNYNWSKTAAENDWCTGSGTYSDPYVIENLYIDADDYGGCIGIYYSKKYFIIRNCWLDNTGPSNYNSGVYMWVGENGTITDNLITYTFEGVYFEAGCINNTVYNNIMISDHTSAGHGRALHISSESHNNTISNNKILNYYDGIGVFQCENVILDDNFVENVIYERFWNSRPIRVHSSNYSKIRRNVLAGAFANTTLSFIINQENCVGNVIEHNIVSDSPDLKFNFSVASSSGSNSLHTSQSSGGLFSLQNSNYNYIGYNVLLGKTKEEAIPSYDVYILLGIVSSLSIIIIIRRIRKK